MHTQQSNSLVTFPTDNKLWDKTGTSRVLCKERVGLRLIELVPVIQLDSSMTVATLVLVKAVIE